MQFRTIGPPGGGLEVSAVGLGCNNFGRRMEEAASAAVIHAALDAGITLFDTAQSYGDGLSETYIGNTLGGRRKDIVLATKFGWFRNGVPEGGVRAAYIMAALESSLKRLQTDYIDLYQFHRPDPDTPIEETLSALDALVRQGKVRFIGCSNFSAAQLAEALAVTDANNAAPFVSAQNQYSLLNRDIEDELLPFCAERGIGLLPFYPLANGMLTGKYRRGEKPPEGTRLAGGRRGGTLTEENFDMVEKLEAFAVARGHTVLELAIAWLLARPSLASVISGASLPEQVAANAAATDWKLGPEELAGIAEITGG